MEHNVCRRWWAVNKGSISLLMLMYVKVLVLLLLVFIQQLHCVLLIQKEATRTILEVGLLHYITRAYDEFEDEDQQIQLLDTGISLVFDHQWCNATYVLDDVAYELQVEFDFECNCIVDYTYLNAKQPAR